MSKDKEDDIAKRLRELDPKYEEYKSSLPDMAAAIEERDAKKVEVSDQDRMFINLLGGAAGASLARRAQAAYDKSAPARAQQMPMRAPGPVGGPAGPVAAGPVTPGVAPGATPAGVMPAAGPTLLGEPGTYGRGVGPGQMTFNYGRAAGLPEIEASRALGMGSQPGEVHDLLGRRREALTAIQQRFPTESYVENPRFGGIMTPDQGVGRGPRASYTTATPEPGQAPPPGGMRPLPPRAPVSTTPPPPGALQRVMGGAQAVGRAGMDLASTPRLAGALGGVGVAEAGQQVYGRYANDPLGATIAGAGGMLGAAAMLPGVPLPARLGLGAVSPLTLYLYDKFRPYRSVLEQPIQ